MLRAIKVSGTEEPGVLSSSMLIVPVQFSQYTVLAEPVNRIAQGTGETLTFDDGRRLRRWYNGPW